MLKKVQMASKDFLPFLLPEEAKINPTITIISEPRVGQTEYRDEQNYVDVRIKKTLQKDEYQSLDLSDENIEKRLSIKERTWSMNPTSWNFLVDKLGTDEALWPNKDVEVDVEVQPIKGERRKVMYAKGSV